MQESFLHYLWKYQQFNLDGLQTTTGQPIEIKHPGFSNNNSGPDFSNAQITIDETLWSGNIEIHIYSSDWIRHHHHTDKTYQSVILHVVFVDDHPIYYSNGTIIPTLELKGKVDESLITKFDQLLAAKTWVPCAPIVPKLDSLILKTWIQRCSIERLEERISCFKKILEQSNNNWSKLLFIVLARGIGQHLNALPFELLASSISLSQIAKHRDNLNQLEALFLGQAGFLHSSLKDPYTQRLYQEYLFLKNKYRLNTLDPSLWKFSRLRPANFPTIRIIQFAHLFYYSEHLLSKIIVAKSLVELSNLFSIQISSYWRDHYILDKEASSKKVKTFGKHAKHQLMINTIIPFQFFYGQYHNNEQLKERSLHFLEQLPPERNTVINEWKAIGCYAENALETQGLLLLKKRYCDLRRCAECSIGFKVLKK